MTHLGNKNIIMLHVNASVIQCISYSTCSHDDDENKKNNKISLLDLPYLFTKIGLAVEMFAAQRASQCVK